MHQRDPASPESQAANQAYLDNPWMIVALLFLVTGALGIPVIWVSRAFSLPTKLLLTVTVILYTLLLCGGVWFILLWSYHRIIDAM